MDKGLVETLTTAGVIFAGAAIVSNIGSYSSSVKTFERVKKEQPENLAAVVELNRVASKEFCKHSTEQYLFSWPGSALARALYRP